MAVACVRQSRTRGLFHREDGQRHQPVGVSSTGNKKTVAKNGAYFQNDGPADHIPVNLNLVPDAVPQEEPLIKSANLPYTALGMSFRPDTREKPYQATGRASWYGKQFHGRKTSSGERYDMFAMTAAHPTLPIPSYARVTNLNNGKSVVVRVNDRGPFHRNRLMDLSYAAAYRLGFIKQGSAKIAIERVWPDAGGENIASTRPVSAALRAEDTPSSCSWAASPSCPTPKPWCRRCWARWTTSTNPNSAS